MASPSDPRDPSGDGRGATVFVVDDDEAVRDSLAVLLEAAGFAVAAFASGRDFLAAYDPREAGCLVLDLDLPDVTGPEVLQALVADGVDLPVILITGRRDGPLRSRAQAAEVVALLEKPFRGDLLLDTVRVALGRRR